MRVPTVQGPSVEERPLQTPMQRSSVSPAMLQDDTAQRAGIGLMEAGNAMQKLQEREDADTILRAETELKNKYLDFEVQAKQRRGQQAWGLTKETDEWWRKEGGRVSETLTTPRQKALFEKSVAKWYESSYRTLSGHEYEQRRESLAASARASAVGSSNMAAANPMDPTILKDAKDDVIRNVDLLANINGWDSKVRDYEQAKLLTHMHTQVVQSLVDKDLKAAQDYYEKNKSEIRGESRNDVEKLFKAGLTLQKSQEFADGVMKAGLTEAEAIAKARQDLEGEDEKMAVLEVKTRFAEQTAARERQQRNAADQAWATYGRTGSLAQVPPSVLKDLDGKDFASIMRDQQDRLYTAERRQQVAEDRNERKERASRKGPETNWDRFYELKTMGEQDPEGFKKLDLRREFSHLDEPERRALINLQSKKPAEVKDAATLSSQLVDTRAALKITNKADAGRFDQAVTAAIEQEQERTGKKLGYDERQKIIDRMAMPGEVLSGSWLKPDPNKRYFETTPEERARFAPEIPAQDRKLIAEQLQSEGIKNPTSDQIMQRFKLKHGMR